MPKVIKKRTVKKTKSEEELQTIVKSTKGFVSKKQRILLPALIITSALILIIGGIYIFRTSQTKKANVMEYEAYKLYYNLYQKQPLNEQEKYTQALEKFQKAYSIRKSPFSLYYIASCYYNLGRYDEALKALKELSERFPDDEYFVPISYYKMAMINLKKDDKESALKSLDKLYNFKNTTSFKDLALIESARILEAMDKKDEAMKKYEELIKKFPHSPFVEEAKAKLATKKG